MAQHTFKHPSDSAMLHDELVAAGIPVATILADTDTGEVEVIVNDDQPGYAATIAAVVAGHDRNKGKVDRRVTRAVQQQAREKLRATKRGNGPMTPAQLTDAVRTILTMLDVD